jgi:L-alanine-DL-glutamate epimerase-like enolase superfamily enzyme
MSSTPRVALEFGVAIERWALRAPFRITGHVFTEQCVVVVTLQADGHTGRGEASGVYYRDDVPEKILEQLHAVRGAVEAGIDRAALQRLLPPGGARNALDCALWELDSKRSGQPVWQLAGLNAPRALLTTYTLSADDPDTMVRTATGFYAAARALKLKLTGDALDHERVRAVRAARPDVWMGVDANQGFTPASLDRLLPDLLAARVELIEQPFPIGREQDLRKRKLPIPVAADESVLSLADLDRVGDCFELVNIKLDKCGGLTEGLQIARAALGRGLKVMVGNMVGTSLAMAPGFLIGQLCDVVDLDGPLMLASDRLPRVQYDDGYIRCPASLWGADGPR